MAKILYIEDELTKNIASIKKFFSPIVNKKRVIDELTKLENEDRVYAEDVLSICKRSSILDICYTFPSALEHIVKGHKEYDLIIIDRNLSEYDYSDQMGDVQNLLESVGLMKDEKGILEFLEREGDLLLITLLRINDEYRDKIFYLTANTADALRGSNELKSFIDVALFTKEKMIEKGSAREEEITNILRNLESFKIQSDYKTECEILRKTGDESLVESFISIVKLMRSNKNKLFLGSLRQLLHDLLNDVALKMNDPNGPDRAEFWGEYNPQLQISMFIRNENGLAKYFNDHYFHYIIKNYAINIHRIGSAYGAHSEERNNAGSKDRDSVSINTLNALFFMMLEVILWYGEAMDKLSEEV
ncbi:MAG: hypothetical protein WCX83_02170 [Candidatus Cloacimonas sp.]|nr:hypothetical protein [Candidatus Cloacimonadota bacterium]